MSIAIQASLKAGEAILDVYKSDFTVEHKSDHSPLTLADKKAHAIIEEYLKTTGIPILSEEGKAIPYEARKQWKELWIVDPLDGTKEFIKKNGEFTVNIALVKEGKAEMGVIYQPVTGLLFFGTSEGAFKLENARAETEVLEKATKLSSGSPETYTIIASRSHLSPETQMFIYEQRKNHEKINFISAGSSLKLCLLAEGKAHLYPRFAPTMEWDTAAGHAILKAAGKNIYSNESCRELQYNKPDLRNEWFVAK